MLLFSKVIKTKNICFRGNLQKNSEWDLPSVSLFSIFPAIRTKDERVSGYNSMLYSQGCATVFILNGTFGDD